MFNWLGDIFTTIIEVFNLTCEKIEELITIIDGVEFSTAMPIFAFQGAVRYVLGEPLYAVVSLSITIGALFFIYKLTCVVFDLIISLIPGMKGKVQFK
ncbi:MAG TPA: hypothetical protein GX731_00670 [Clostridiales bacterium]|nr:hypothetical protein [Clostridiales bacterium]